MPVKITKTININDKEYTLVASFRALQEIERVLGTGLLEILHRAKRKDIKITEVAAVIYGGLYGNKDLKKHERLSFEQVGELIAEHGFMKYAPDVLLFLSDVVMAGHEEQTAGEETGKATEASRDHA